MSASQYLNERQRKFVLLVVHDVIPAGRVYESVGYRARGSSADVGACNLLKNPKVKAYLEELREAEEIETIMSLQEQKEWLTRAIRTPLSKIDENDPLCVESTVTTSETGGQVKIKKVDPLRAMDQLSELTNAKAAAKVEISADDDLSEILKGMSRTEPAGEDKM